MPLRPTRSYHPDTIAIHGGQPNELVTGAVIQPIFQTTTFAQSELGGTPQWCYSRTGNPTRSALEANLAALEGARFGLAFASGLAAANTVLLALSAGDHVVASQDLYGGCYRLFTKVFARFGVKFSLIDTTNPRNVELSIRPETKILWLETPSNPLLKVTDIAECAAIARAKGVATLVDNTFATPVHQRPLELGADLVLHSTTKYIGGHCDVIGGAIVTSDPSWHERLKFLQNATGAVPGPQDCFLLLRGIKTLSLRVERHTSNAQRVAEFLDAHAEVERVIYPGLPSHPQHELASRQCSGFGSIISVELRGGVERVRRFVRTLRLWPLAESLGGVKSLLCHPATMTHASVEPAERQRIGISDGLIRLSVGIEDVRDLIADLETALTRSSRPARASTDRVERDAVAEEVAL
jgi:cystathionine gamma-lyase